MHPHSVLVFLDLSLIILEFIGVTSLFLHVQAAEGLLLKFEFLEVNLRIRHIHLLVVVMLECKLVQLREHARTLKLRGDMTDIDILDDFVL